jgi:hypothetical protein
MQKLLKKEKKEFKNGQVSELLKQWVRRCSPEKRKEKMNKIAHVFLQLFSRFKREMFQGA